MKKLLPFGVALVVLGVMAGTAYFTAGPTFAQPPMGPKPNDFPSWDKTFDAATRFELVLGDAGVFDKETGVVWEQAPDTATLTWFEALFNCYTKTVGDRKGWRLPTIEELTTLLAPDGPVFLPDPHPFAPANVGFFRWSSTTFADDADQAWGVHFFLNLVIPFSKTEGLSARAWCVRGGHGHDGGH